MNFCVHIFSKQLRNDKKTGNLVFVSPSSVAGTEKIPFPTRFAYMANDILLYDIDSGYTVIKSRMFKPYEVLHTTLSLLSPAQEIIYLNYSMGKLNELGNYLKINHNPYPKEIRCCKISIHGIQFPELYFSSLSWDEQTQ